MKTLIIVGLFFLLFQNEQQRVLGKIDKMGKEGRSQLIVKKAPGSFRIAEDTETESKYLLRLSNNENIYFLKYEGEKADAFKIYEKHYVVSKEVNDLMVKGFNPRYLSLELMDVNEVTLKGRKYIIIITGVQSASGKAVNYSMYFIFDITNKKDVKYMPAISYYGDIKNITDIDNDGKLDFLKATMEHERLIEIEAYNIFPPKKKTLINKQVICLK